jgi:hypothetical protein
MLLEGIRQAHELVAQQEEEMRQGAVPQIFRDYANAGEEAKAAMKVSSRQGNEEFNHALTLISHSSAEPIRPDQATLPLAKQVRVEEDPQPEPWRHHRLHGTEPRALAASELALSSFQSPLCVPDQSVSQDREVLQRLEVETVVPSLEARHAALQSDLVAERALDRELSAMSAEDIEIRQNMLADAEEQEYVPASFGLPLWR